MVEPGAESSDLIEELKERCREGGSPRPFAPLAEALRLSGDPSRAADTARRGLESFPDHAAMRIVLARALDDLGDHDGAREEYALVLRRDPRNVEAASRLGFEREGETEPGVGTAGEKSGVGPTSLSEELEHLSDLFTPPGGPGEGPAESIATLTLAEIYARQGLFERAVEVCEAILSRSPDDGAAAGKLREYRRELAEIGQ